MQRNNFEAHFESLTWSEQAKNDVNVELNYSKGIYKIKLRTYKYKYKT